MAETKTETLIHVRSAAGLLSCTEKHIYDMIKDGRLEAVRLGPRGLRVIKESVLKYVSENKVNPEDYFA